MPLSPTALQAGKLRHRIQIVNLTLAQDSSGGFSETNATVFATLWASVESDAGRLREIYGGQQRVGENYFKVTFRWIDGVNNAQNVWWDGHTFQILQVENPDGRQKLLKLLCVERDESARTPGGIAP